MERIATGTSERPANGAPRKRLLALLLGLSLAAVAGPVSADTTGGGEADLGLESITVTSVVVSREGTATVTGSITCSQDVVGYGFVTVRQDVGRFFVVQGDAWLEFTCDASAGSTTFSAVATPYGGKFAGGRATVSAGAQVETCDAVTWECSYDTEYYGPASVRLRG
jgi:hypothetical protein